MRIGERRRIEISQDMDWGSGFKCGDIVICIGFTDRLDEEGDDIYRYIMQNIRNEAKSEFTDEELEYLVSDEQELYLPSWF